ncbi:hypothetical protein E0485_02860 [Paenibacillus albiflavus]|uniref:Uncharacterized protein n=1 Tax=Paenibacillus albiflavus TaxID=2545760 RepID=A0A4R4EP39_9BACL|nr:hypothetical protein [Paenibacillus albiflavus]TCZ81230.1 hypothetical protein E0485_02860 [Paenibacillus albiflavus]
MSHAIVAIVTTNREYVGGGAPIFIVPDEKELQRVSLLLESITDTTAHDLRNDVMILFKH